MTQYASLKARMRESFRKRMYVFISIVVLAFVFLLGQIVNLQFIKGAAYKEKARSNMEDFVPIPASRGEIYDRSYDDKGEKRLLVSNRPSFNISTIPAKFASPKEMDQVLRRISRAFNIQYESLQKEIAERNAWERIILKEDVPFESIVVIATYPEHFPHIDWEDAPVRVYNHNYEFSHVLGYIGSISREEYGRLREQGYRHYQKIGKAGIEKAYDTQLRGADGYVRRIVDVRNRTEGEEVGLRPVPGNNLVVTLDYDIQKAASDAMAAHNGAVVVLKPFTGEVLALLSKPDFDPNEIISRNNQDIFSELLKDKSRPFLNRAIQAKYPPASTFKLITAVSALETEKTYPGKTYMCSGKYTLKGYRDRDFYCYAVHGRLDLYHAIAKSCSAYFYQLGYHTGPTTILRYADYFGLDEMTGIDIPGEVAGFIPSKKWKLRTFGQSWFDGDTINLSIGQGFLAVTPVAMANFVAALVNGGIVYKPHVVKKVLSHDNSEILAGIDKEKLREIPLSPLTLKAVQQGMRMSVTMGTSQRLKYLSTPLAGKTGTAQTRSLRKADSTQHAWFVGFGPYGGTAEDSVVVAVMVEYGIAGAATAVPVAEVVFRALESKGYMQQQGGAVNAGQTGNL